MAEIINLNKVRKIRRRQAEQQAAAENRRVHGESRLEREARRTEAESARAILDGHKID